MTPRPLNRIKVNLDTEGTGSPLALGTAVTRFQTFEAAGAAHNDLLSYLIEDGTEWELGTGRYDATAQTLTRDMTQSSTGALLDLSPIATIAVVMRAEDERLPTLPMVDGEIPPNLMYAEDGSLIAWEIP